VKLEKAGPPTPFKEQKSVEVIEKKEEEFSLVQKSEGMVLPKLEIGKLKLEKAGCTHRGIWKVMKREELLEGRLEVNENA